MRIRHEHSQSSAHSACSGRGGHVTAFAKLQMPGRRASRTVCLRNSVCTRTLCFCASIWSAARPVPGPPSAAARVAASVITAPAAAPEASRATHCIAGRGDPTQ